MKTATPTMGGAMVSHFSIGTWIFFLAFAMIFIGMLLMTFGSLTGSGFNGGAVVLIGPIPIILGTGSYSMAMIALAAVLSVIVIVFFVFMRRKLQRST